MQPQPCIFVHGFCGSEDQCRRLRLAPTHERDELLSDEDEKFLLPPSCIFVHGCGPRTSVGGCATREPSNETSFCPTGREVLVAAVVLRARLRPEDQCRGLRHARTLERDELLSDEDEKLLLPPSRFVHGYGPRTNVGGCATREPSNETSFCPTRTRSSCCRRRASSCTATAAWKHVGSCALQQPSTETSSCLMRTGNSCCCRRASSCTAARAARRLPRRRSLWVHFTTEPVVKPTARRCPFAAALLRRPCRWKKF